MARSGMARRDTRMIDSIGFSPIATVISDPRRADNPIIAANAGFLALTGYREADVVGRNCRFLAGDETDDGTTDQLREAIRSARPVLAEIVNYRADGTAFRNGVLITPLFDDDGALAWYLGSQVDLGPPALDGFAERRREAARKVERLAPRQRQVLALVADGLLNKQIAHRLGIAEKTVKMHRAIMLDRLGAATSADAIRIAVEAGLST
jgi:hypothetical protein